MMTATPNAAPNASPTVHGSDLLPGFAEPVTDAALVFRCILDAMAHPGRVVSLPVLPQAPEPLSAVTGAVLLDLVDADTPVYLHPDYRNDAVVAHLAFHCGAPLTEDPAQARFLVVPVAALEAVAAQAAIGTPDYPDRSATILVQVDGFDEAQAMHLSGPGIADSTDFSPSGLSDRAWEALRRNAALYPLGFDTIFTTPEALAALPRSTRIGAQEV